MRRITFIGVSVALVAALALAKPRADQPRESEPVSFRPFSEFNPRGVGRLDIKVQGVSLVAPPREAFPASFWANLRCSATLVGEEVLVSAAHCFRSIRYVNLELGVPRQGECQTAEDITNGTLRADFAICRMDEVAKVAQYETVDMRPDAIRKDDPMLLTGFGGNREIGSGTYLLGGTTVISVENGIITTKDGAWTQPGDSGGAGFSVNGDRRRLISVNARFDEDLKTSYATQLSAAREAVQSWQTAQRAKGHKVWICGLDPEGPALPAVSIRRALVTAKTLHTRRRHR